jgi:hypothetical protein
MRATILGAALLLLAVPVTQVGAQARRALLVGIGDYGVHGGDALRGRGLGNLEGPVHDVEAVRALLIARFGFRPEDILELTDAAATRDAILSGVRDHLGRSRAGDHALFFYAGHGSWVENSLSDEADRRDETLVPADAGSGAPDIRDKELRGPFSEILDHGADVTLIFDACHSGSITRAMEEGRDRSVRPAPGDIADGTVYPDPPQEHRSGRALVLSAARDDQKAREFRTEDGVVAGAFTWALVDALRDAPTGVPSAYLFQQLRALMKERGFEQEPVFEAGEPRRAEPMFSDDPDARYSGAVVPILSIESGGSVVLQGGVALGLRPGTELVSAEGNGRDAPVRLRVARSLGVARSRADLVAGSLRGLEAGDLFAVDRWAADPSAPLRFWIPPAASDVEEAEAVLRAASLLRSDPGIRWVEDPTLDPPTHTLLWTGTEWRLSGPAGTSDLGAAPTMSGLREALAREDRPVALFAALPPGPGMRESVLEESGRSQSGPGVAIADDPGGATYRLVGTVEKGERQYYWLHVRAATGGSPGGMPPTTEPVAGDRRAVSRSLVAQVDRLARSWGWLHLWSPPGGADFPYRISGFERERDARGVALGDTLTWGERYRVVLEAPAAALDAGVRSAFDGGTARWHWYLFALDREGIGTLLYPRASNQPNQVNLLAPGAAGRTRLTVPGDAGWLFSPAASNPGARSDFATLFLLASAEPLPDPAAVLNFAGVGSRAAVDEDTEVVEAGTLSRLLFDLGSGDRSEARTGPVHWAIQRAPLASIARR